MIIVKYIIFFLSIITMVSCASSDKEDKISHPPIKQNKKIEPESITVNIQPFVGTDTNLVRHVYKQLKKTHTKVIIKKPIKLPKSAYYKPRKRYRADSLIVFLKKLTHNNSITVGITNKDISHTKGKIKDYGILGLGFQPGLSCIISSYRLSKSNTKEQLFKVTIHEIGHTQGLKHCKNITCYMRDAKGKNYLDEEVDFCKKCKAYMVTKNWYN